MPTTLVTGANGFVAAHVVNQLIQVEILIPPTDFKAGHRVIGSVRSPKKGEQLLSVHPEWEGKLAFVTVSDYTKPGTWDETFRDHDIDYVAHIAAPLLDNPENVDFDKFFLEPSVKGLLRFVNSVYD